MKRYGRKSKKKSMKRTRRCDKSTINENDELDPGMNDRRSDQELSIKDAKEFTYIKDVGETVNHPKP